MNNIKNAAITQLINAFGPAICAPIKGVNSHADPIMPPAAAINILLVDISRFSNFLNPFENNYAQGRYQCPLILVSHAYRKLN